MVKDTACQVIVCTKKAFRDREAGVRCVQALLVVRHRRPVIASTGLKMDPSYVCGGSAQLCECCCAIAGVLEQGVKVTFPRFRIVAEDFKVVCRKSIPNASELYLHFKRSVAGHAEVSPRPRRQCGLDALLLPFIVGVPFK